MTSSRTPPRTIHRARSGRRRVAALLVAVALAAALGDQVLATSSSTAPSPDGVPAGGPHPPPSEHRHVPRERGAPGRPGPAVPDGRVADALGEADGAVPDGTTVFDDGVPGVAKLDPALIGALRRAAAAAADEGVTFLVDSGWRSREYQQRLLDEAIARYGSEEEAARWVADPDRSAHVSGDAVDIGPSDAAAWLSHHGAAYGLCQTYANEPWHFELRPEAPGRGCPAPYADPTHDPRLRQ